MSAAIVVNDLTEETSRRELASAYLDLSWTAVTLAELQFKLLGVAKPVEAMVFADEIRFNVKRVEHLRDMADTADPSYCRTSARVAAIKARLLVIKAGIR